MPRKRKRVKIDKKFIWVTAAILFAAAAADFLIKAIAAYPGFNVRRIEINADSSAAEQAKTLVEGKNIFAIDRQKIRDSIIKQHPEIKDVFIVKKYPASIFINIIKRAAALQFKMRKFYVLDREGVVIKGNLPLPLENIPVLSGKFLRQNPFLGENLSRNKTVRYALDTLRILKDKGISLARISSISVAGEYNISFVLDGVKIITARSNSSEEIASLAGVILRQFAKDWADIEYLDLRFKDPIVHYKR